MTPGLFEETAGDPGPGRTWLFVYGLLKPGLFPPQTMTEAWADRVAGRLYDLGSCPALIEVTDWSSPPISEVTGFTLNIALSELPRLDDFEEASADRPTYVRRRVVTACGFTAWVYVYARALPETARGPLTTWAPADVESD